MLAMTGMNNTVIGKIMGNLIVGFVLGVAACTIGFGKMAQMADNGVYKIQHVVREVAR